MLALIWKWLLYNHAVQRDVLINLLSETICKCRSGCGVG